MIITPNPVRRRPPQHRAKPVTALAVVGYAGFSVSGGNLDVHFLFNTSEAFPLTDASGADPTKWTARYAGQRYLGSDIVPIAADELLIVYTAQGAEAGPNVTNYAADPSDIADVRGRKLIRFTALPLP
jgi:hypothetical protein